MSDPSPPTSERDVSKTSEDTLPADVEVGPSDAATAEERTSSASGVSSSSEESTARSQRWMKEALVLAEKALRRGEVPVGCLFIYKEKVLAVGSNQVNETKNATRHAEMTCIDTVLDWCKETSNNYQDIFPQIEVVVTVEPCIMCASALHQLHVGRVVYGAANSRFGGCVSVLDVSKVHTDSRVTIVGGVFAEEAVSLLKLFYEGTNPNAPNPKVKKKKLEKEDGS